MRLDRLKSARVGGLDTLNFVCVRDKGEKLRHFFQKVDFENIRLNICLTLRRSLNINLIILFSLKIAFSSSRELLKRENDLQAFFTKQNSEAFLFASKI
jgi:hypothetical protein